MHLSNGLSWLLLHTVAIYALTDTARAAKRTLVEQCVETDACCRLLFQSFSLAQVSRLLIRGMQPPGTYVESTEARTPESPEFQVSFGCQDTLEELLSNAECRHIGSWYMNCPRGQYPRWVEKQNAWNSGKRQTAVCVDHKPFKSLRKALKAGVTDCLELVTALDSVTAWQRSVEAWTSGASGEMSVASFLSITEQGGNRQALIKPNISSITLTGLQEDHAYRACARNPPGLGNVIFSVTLF